MFVSLFLCVECRVSVVVFVIVVVAICFFWFLCLMGLVGFASCPVPSGSGEAGQSKEAEGAESPLNALCIQAVTDRRRYVEIGMART